MLGPQLIKVYHSVFVIYCKFGNFGDGFIFAKLKLLQNCEMTLLFTDVGKSHPNHKFLTWKMSFNAIPENKILTKISEFTVENHTNCNISGL